MEAAFELQEGMFHDIPSEVYHTIPNSFSSSQLKDAYKDIGVFHAKYITKTIEKEEGIPAFAVGTYFHTAILEPDKISHECAVYKGIRRGAEWEKFKEANKNKAIVTESEMAQAESLVSAVRNSTIAMNRISRGSPEVSCFAILRVVGSDIYAPSFGKILGKYGWEDCKSVPKKGVDIWVKVRADLLATDFILDLKSTSGNVKDPYKIQSTVSTYSYDLSASFYLDIFSLSAKRTLTDFVWTFASKDYGNCKNYIASASNVLVGRVKWRNAILNIAEGMENNWVIPDTLTVIDPSYFEYNLLKESGETLL